MGSLHSNEGQGVSTFWSIELRTSGASPFSKSDRITLMKWGRSYDEIADELLT